MEDRLEKVKRRVRDVDSPIKTIKGVSEALGMTETGFYKMVRRDKLKHAQLLALCDVLNVGPTYFGEQLSEVQQNLTNVSDNSGDGLIRRLIAEIDQIKDVFEEQLRVKDKQLESKDNQINSLLSLLGKIEGVIGRPLFSEVELLELGIVLP